MGIKIRNPKDFWAGVLFVCLGAGTVLIGSAYKLGTAAEMGPGYFPRVLGILLIVLGSLVCLFGLKQDGEPIKKWHWRPTVIVLGSLILFGFIVSHLGVVLSTLLLIFVSSMASKEFRFKESLILGVFLAILVVSVFIIGLKLQLPIWPTFH